MQQTCPYRATISFNKNTYCFGTQQLQTQYTFIYSTPLCFTLLCVTLTYSRYYILHCITSHTCAGQGWFLCFQCRLMNSSHVIQTCLQRGVIKLLTHTWRNGCHTDSERFHNFDSYSELQTNTWENPTERKCKMSQKLVARVFFMHLLLEKIWCVSTTHHVELNETSVWKVIVDTSNPHNLTIPFDDMRFDAVEETVAAAPAALKTPMLVTSAQGGSLITKDMASPVAWFPRRIGGDGQFGLRINFSPGRVGWHIHQLPQSAGKVFFYI